MTTSPRQEGDRVASRQVLAGTAITLAGIALCVALTLGLAGGAVLHGAATAPKSPLPNRPVELGPIPPANRGEANPELHEYHWVDRSTGRVSIPIDVAMDEYLRRRRQETTP